MSITRLIEGKYAAECDRLSEIEASKSSYQRWGRWLLNKSKPFRSIDCIQMMPKAQGIGHWKIDPYWIELSRIGHNGEMDGSKYTWQEHLSEKIWIGRKGIADFVRAIKEIAAEHPTWLRE